MERALSCRACSTRIATICGRPSRPWRTTSSSSPRSSCTPSWRRRTRRWRCISSPSATRWACSCSWPSSCRRSRRTASAYVPALISETPRYARRWGWASPRCSSCCAPPSWFRCRRRRLTGSPTTAPPSCCTRANGSRSLTRFSRCPSPPPCSPNLPTCRPKATPKE